MNDHMDVATDLKWHARRRVRILLAGIFAAMICVGAAMLILRTGEPTLSLDQIVLATVREDTGVRELRAAGELGRQRRIAIQASADGVVQSVNVEPGTAVREGASLVVLSNVDLELAARTAMAELEVTRAELSSTEARLVGQVEAQRMELARARSELEISTIRGKGHRRLFDAGMISEMALSEHRSAYELAKLKVDIESRKLAAVEMEYAVHARSAATRVAITQDSSDRARDRVTEMTIPAPFEGIAERFPFAAGESVKRGDEVVSFASNSGMDAVVRVLERSAQRVRSGSQAMIVVGQHKVPASVQRMDPQVENGVVKVTLRPTSVLPASWLPGQRVDSLIKVGSPGRSTVVRRPVGVVDDSSAVVLRRSPDGKTAVGVSAVFGIGTEGEVEVVGGLSAGDQIIVSDVGRIRAGQIYKLR